MLDKGVIERVVIDYKDIHKDAIENGMKTPLDIPYFEGDFCSIIYFNLEF